MSLSEKMAVLRRSMNAVPCTQDGDEAKRAQPPLAPSLRHVAPAPAPAPARAPAFNAYEAATRHLRSERIRPSIGDAYRRPSRCLAQVAPRSGGATHVQSPARQAARTRSRLVIDKSPAFALKPAAASSPPRACPACTFVQQGAHSLQCEMCSALLEEVTEVVPSSTPGRLTPEPDDDGGNATSGKCSGQGQRFMFGGALLGIADEEKEEEVVVAEKAEAEAADTPSEDDADMGAPSHDAREGEGGEDATTSWAPRLTKPAHSCTPSLAELEQLSPEELSQVEGFSVSRAGVGSIRWLSAVDLTGVDLDAAVSLEKAFVSVYEREEDEGVAKPKRGEKLNGPCVCTLHGVLNKDPAKVERRTNKMPGATFLSYSPRTGDWVFETEGW